MKKKSGCTYEQPDFKYFQRVLFMHAKTTLSDFHHLRHRHHQIFLHHLHQ